MDLNKSVSNSPYIYLNAYYHTHDITMHSDADGHWEACSECSFATKKEAHDGHWEDGVCSVCGYECPHTEENGTFCSVCGKYLGNHAYEEGKYLDYDPVSKQLISKDIPDGTKPVTSESTALEAGWYTVADTLTVDGRMMLGGDVHIILMDGADLTVSGGIGLEDGANLTVYAQSTGIGAGALTVSGVQDGYAGIGSDGEGTSLITVNGGTVNAAGGNGGAGIGGSRGSTFGGVTVNSGFVTATGGSGAAGIGSGDSGSCLAVTLSGGSVLATGGSGADGIGGSCLETVVNGGVIRADKGSGGSYNIAAATVSPKVKYDSGEGEACRTINCVYYPPVEPTCTATGLAEYYKSSLDGRYYTAMPFSSATNVAEEDIPTECLVPTAPHTFEFLDPDQHVCSVCHTTEQHSFSEDGDCACGLATHGEEDRCFRACGEDGVWRTLYLPQSVTLKEITKAGEYEGGWYILEGSQTINGQIAFKDDAYLILANGADVRCKGVMLQENASLTLYDQSADESKMGKLTVEKKSSSYGAGIGSFENKSCGDITIHGGNISVMGSIYGAGIGSGFEAGCGDITIHGGKISARGGGSSAAIGSGGMWSSCGDITITGGTVEALPNDSAAGIGSGWDSVCGDIRISGGNVTATGGNMAAGIGNGLSGDSAGNATCGNISITGGVVTATAGEYGESIGNSKFGKCGTVSIGEDMAAYELLGDTLLWQLDSAEQLADISRARVQTRIPDFDCPSYLDYENGKPVHKLIPATATEIAAPGEYGGGWYVLSGEQVLNGQIVFKDDAHVVLKNGANIETQGIALQEGVSLVLYAQSADEKTMGRLNATASSGSAGIGGGKDGCGDITVNGGDITATSEFGCPGIGAGFFASGSNKCRSITVNGGTIDATGGKNAPGIGASIYGNCGLVVFNGGETAAHGGENAGAVGDGRMPAGYHEVPGKCDGVKLGSSMAAVELAESGILVPHFGSSLSWLNTVKGAEIADFSLINPGGDVDEPANDGTGESGKQAPRTGDTGHAALWLALTCLSVMGATVILKKKKA